MCVGTHQNKMIGDRQIGAFIIICFRGLLVLFLLLLLLLVLLYSRSIVVVVVFVTNKANIPFAPFFKK